MKFYLDDVKIYKYLKATFYDKIPDLSTIAVFRLRLKAQIHYSKSSRKDNIYSLKSTKHLLNDMVVLFIITFLRYQDISYRALMTNRDKH